MRHPQFCSSSRAPPPCFEGSLPAAVIRYRGREHEARSRPLRPLAQMAPYLIAEIPVEGGGPRPPDEVGRPPNKSFGHVEIGGSCSCEPRSTASRARRARLPASAHCRRAHPAPRNCNNTMLKRLQSQLIHQAPVFA